MRGFTILRFYNFTILQFYNFTILQFYNYTIIRLYNFTILNFTKFSKISSMTRERDQIENEGSSTIKIGTRSGRKRTPKNAARPKTILITRNAHDWTRQPQLTQIISPSILCPPSLRVVNPFTPEDLGKFRAGRSLGNPSIFKVLDRTALRYSLYFLLFSELV